MYTGLNTTLYSYRQAANANTLPRLTPTDWTALNSTIATAARANRNLIDPKVSQTGQLPSFCYSHTAVHVLPAWTQHQMLSTELSNVLQGLFYAVS